MSSSSIPLVSSVAVRLPDRTRVLALALGVLAFGLYLFVGSQGSGTDEFIPLAGALLRGEFAVDARPWVELVPVGSLWYVPFPPVPALFYMPVVAIMGVRPWNEELAMGVMPAIVGALSVGVAFLLLRKRGVAERPADLDHHGVRDHHPPVGRGHRRHPSHGPGERDPVPARDPVVRTRPSPAVPRRLPVQPRGREPSPGRRRRPALLLSVPARHVEVPRGCRPRRGAARAVQPGAFRVDHGLRLRPDPVEQLDQRARDGRALVQGRDRIADLHPSGPAGDALVVADDRRVAGALHPALVAVRFAAARGAVPVLVVRLPVDATPSPSASPRSSSSPWT